MAILAVFAALVLAALIGPLARVAFADGISPIALAFMRSALGGALFALEALARGQLRMGRRAALRSAAFGALIQLVIPTPRAALAIVAISAASTYGAYRLHGLALRHLPPGRVALLGAAEPVLAAVIGSVFWGEPIGATFWCGAALILSSGLITQPGEL